MSRTVRTVTCPTCHNAFPQGRGAISVCPRCGERVLVPALDDEEEDAPKPPASEIASIPVECQLCSSRFYAKPSQLGQTMKCPDCHTENVVAEAASRAPKKTLPALSELTDAEDFKLSEPVETPRYQALTRDALEFERALRSAEGLEVKPLGVDPKPVHAPLAPPKSQPATAPSADDELMDLGPDPEPLAIPSSPPVQREKRPVEQGPPAGPDEIELFPEDRMPAASPPRPQAKPQAEEPVELDDEEDSHIEVRVEAPVQRVEYKAVITLPKADKPDDSDYGSEVDFKKLKQSLSGLMAGSGAGLPPELARRKPFTAQTLLFFLQMGIFGRFVALALMVVGEFYAMSLVMELLQADNPAGVIGAFLFYVMAFLLGAFCFLLIAMFCFTIVQDTANGQDKIESWPELSLFSWFESAIFFGAAIFLAGLPGALFAGALSGLGVSFWVSYWISPLILLTSLIILFPPVLISMLEAGSVMEPISAAMLRSFKPLLKFWLQLYAWSLAIGFLGLVVFNLTFSSAWLMLPGAAILTALPFLYFRLVGRMAMMYRDYVAATSPDDEEESGPAVRHVIQ